NVVDGLANLAAAGGAEGDADKRDVQVAAQRAGIHGERNAIAGGAGCAAREGHGLHRGRGIVHEIERGALHAGSGWGEGNHDGTARTSADLEGCAAAGLRYVDDAEIRG